MNWRCRHPATEPVVTLDGRLVNNLCTDCYSELPSNWGCEECQWETMKDMHDDVVFKVSGSRCELHR